MDKETVALIIAQNGLLTASTLLMAKRARLEKQHAKAKTPQEAGRIAEQMRKAEKLATALRIANSGIVEYQAETSE